ncbi:MAG: hypothetical protein HYV29_03980 [Ignavibacteriales bacterium]|nr:hypothetical protein [Ignavibacteriales bacterium]
MIITSFKLRSLHIWAVLLPGILLLNSLYAQIAKPGYDDKMLFRGATGVTTGAVQQQYTLSGYGTVSQQSAPLSIAVPISNRMLLAVANSAGMTTADTSELQGIADTRISLSYVLPGEKFWIAAGASIPTGKTKLSNTELKTSTIISQAALGMKVPVFGQGFGGNVGIAYATAFTRRLVFGVGTSFAYKGSYEPIEAASITYDAGDEVSVNVGLDFITFSKEARFSFDVSGTYFLEDKLDGKKIFQSGPRAIMFAVYSLKTGAYNHQLSSRVRYRLQNTSITDSVSTKFDAGLQAEGQYSLTHQLNEWLVGSAVLEAKYYTPDQFQLGGQLVESGNAEIGSAGADFVFIVSDILFPTLNIRYSFGNITIDDSFYEISGFEIGMGLKISF